MDGPIGTEDLSHLDELTRWLQDLDGPSQVTNTIKKAPKVASKPSQTMADSDSTQQDMNMIDFESILGDLSTLDRLFDASSSSCNTSTIQRTQRLPPPPLTNGNQTNGNHGTVEEFDNCDAVLRDALLDLNSIAQQTVDISDCSNSATTSSRVNGNIGTPRRDPGSVTSVSRDPGSRDPGSVTPGSRLTTVGGSTETLPQTARKNSVDNDSAILSSGVPANMKANQTCVQVFLQDGASSHVMVDDQLTAGQLCQILMKKRNVPLITCWSIVEHLPDMFMERRIEQQEYIQDVIRNWARGSTNRLVFVENVDRYAVYDSEQQDKISSWSDVKGTLHLKSEEKKLWKKLDFSLQSSGLCYCQTTSKGGKSEIVCLQSLTDVDVYMAVGWRKKYKSPTEFGFALKPEYVQRKSPKCVKYLCAEDNASLVRWITAIRLAKFGRGLYSISRGPQLSHESTESPPSVDTSMSSSPVSASILQSDEYPPGPAANPLHRRKGSKGNLVPALPISTQTTRLLSQQQQTRVLNGKDDSDSSGPHTRSTTNRLSSTSSSSTLGSLDRFPCTELPPPPPVSTLQAQWMPSPTDLPPPPSLVTCRSAVQSPAHHPVSVDRCSTLSTRPGSSMTLPRCAVSPTSPPLALSTVTPAPPPTSSVCVSKTMPRSQPLEVDIPRPPSVAPVQQQQQQQSSAGNSPARAKPPPPKRSENTKLSFSAADQRQTKTFIMNLDRCITQKGSKGSQGLGSIPVPLPPRPAYVEGPTYLDTDDLPPPPAELLEGLRVMRRQAMPLPPIPAPGRR